MMIRRDDWYKDTAILFELIFQAIHKETFFLPYDPFTMKSTPPIRWLKCDCIKFLKRNMEKFKFYDRPMNLYHSLATYDQFPMFSYNWRFKSQEQSIWSIKFKDYLEKFDMFIETDSDDLKESVGDGIGIGELLNDYKIKFSQMWSGSKGIHVVIPYEEFKHLGLHMYDKKDQRLAGNFEDFLQSLPIKKEKMTKVFDLVLLFKVMNLRLKTIFAFDTIDTSISDILRVKKSAYSWDVKSGLIALPLDDNQLKNFSKKIVTPETVMKMGVRKRGLLWRNTDVCSLKRKVGINQLIEDLGIWE